MPRATRRELLKGVLALGVYAALPIRPAEATQLFYATQTESELAAMTEAEYGAMLESPVPTTTTLSGSGTLSGATGLR